MADVLPLLNDSLHFSWKSPLKQRINELEARREGKGSKKEAEVCGSALRAKSLTCLSRIRFWEQDGNSSSQGQQGGNDASGESQIFLASLSTVFIQFSFGSPS